MRKRYQFMNVEWTTRTTNNVTLVEVIVTNDGPPRRVRVSNELDGPVWPPRIQEIPTTGWNEHGYEGRVENRRVLGYATPAPVLDPPVSVEWLEIVNEEQQRSRHPTVPSIDPEPTPNSVCRTLNDPRPPRDAVPVVESVVENVNESIVNEVNESGQIEQVKRTERTSIDRYERTRPRDEREVATQDNDHPAVESLFRIIERRIDDGEMLTAVETLPDATWAVETVGGLTAVSDLMTALDGDCETLQAIEERAARLRERAETIDVPVDTLERLA
jgi:hypothetical protein